MIDPEAQYHATVRGAGVFQHIDRSVLRVTGTDRFTWLQGMVSNDVRLLANGSAAISACILDSTGHMLADAHVVNAGDSLLLNLPKSSSQSIFRLLDAYIVMEDVAIADESNTVCIVSVQGPMATEQWINALALGDEEDTNAAADHTGLGGFDIYIGANKVDGLIGRLLMAGAIELSETVVESLRIEAGIPKFGVDMTIKTMPMEARLETTHVSFNKGCYMGQEIIARIHARGHVNKLISGLLADSLHEGLVGATLLSASEPEREVGRITSVAYSYGLGRPVGMGYVRTEFIDDGTKLVSSQSSGGQNIVVASLPMIRHEVPTK